MHIVIFRKSSTMSAFAKFLASPQPGEEIVVSGISGKFPSCDGIYDFQEKLFNKRDMIEDIIKRWHFNSEIMPSRGGTINNIDRFDAGFFGIHGKQANIMDPMMRIFLETALEAIFDAGLNPKELEGTRTGVYVGACWSDAEYSTLISITEPQSMGITGFLRAFLCQRLAYFLKLKGPCFIADTACSSSLNALESAFKDLRSGKCDRALVGGVNLTLFPGSTLQFYKLGVLSLDGKCKVFDEEADGYVRSETITCVLLEKAKYSRRIYAQVVYAKVNSDGFKSSGITFPSAEMQSVLMREVYEESGVDPNDLSYIEGHCTGTKVGDAVEVEAIDSVLGKKREKPLFIGSVKSNVGHTEPCSGLCSLAKVIIAMETGLIPPNINLKTLKKGLTGLKEGRLKPVLDVTPIEGENLLVSINNFGFGGNNCHLILKRLNKRRSLNEINDSVPRLVCVSGRTEEAVLKILKDIKQREFNVEYIRLLQEMFKFEIKGHNYRGYTIVTETEHLKTSTSRMSNKIESFHLNFGDFDKHYKANGKSLIEICPFKQSLMRFNYELKEKNLDIFEIIFMLENDPLLDILGSAAVQIAISDTIKALKLEPASIHGDSWGKLALLYFQGFLNIKQIVKIIFENVKSSNIDVQLQKFCNKINNIQGSTNESNLPDVLNLSNSKTSIVNGTEPVVILLDFIGKLYKIGNNPQIQNLYPDVKFPVSRGTPMISPLISWNHSKSWFTCRYISDSEKSHSNSFQIEAVYNPLNYEHSFIQGHVIDGRNLFPATGYLYMIWRGLSAIRRLTPNDIGIVFEDVHFLSASTFPNSGYLTFVLSVKMDHTFEISQGNVVVVRGRACLNQTVKESSDFPARDFHDGGCSFVMDKEDFYKELSLRGYNYKGLFQGVVKANIDATSGLVKWEDNWVAFMDNMLQLLILNHDTRNLYVPTGIKRCVIIPIKQTKGINVEVPITVYREADIIRCESVEIYGLEAKSIARKRQANDPMLEKYIFVPNFANLTLEASLRISVQIILENSQETSIKALELFDDFLNNEVEALLPMISKVLEEIPLIKSDFTISSKREAEDLSKDLDSIKVEPVQLTTENNYLLLIGSKILENNSSLRHVLGCLKKNSFLLTREDKNCVLGEVEGLQVLTVHTTENEKLILLRKTETKNVNYSVIEVSSDSFDWLTQLQAELKKNSKNKIIIYSQNQTDSGIVGLTNCILRENRGDRCKCFFILGEAPKFDINCEFYKTQIEKNVSINIYKDGKWGTYRHLLLNKIEASEYEHCLISNTVKGDLSSLKWVRGSLDTNFDDENLVQVHYSAVNFKDIMLASGRISADVFISNRIEQENVLGMEYSGITLKGKRLMGMAQKQALSTLVKQVPLLTWEVPEHWSLEEAATVPVVYSTVIYGLLIRRKLERGMSVLIHSGTGGIGLAAIHVCSYYGCEIFVTVGTVEKREFLKKHFPHIPHDHIGNSRDTSFEQMIEKHRSGRGVDIVLNSLAEEKLLASVRCLAKGGSFVEIGKFDLSQNNPLSLLIMEKEASFHGVMLDTLLSESQEIKEELSIAVAKGIAIGYVKPLPVNIFHHQEVEDAFRFMTSGKHIGKILVKIRENENDTRKFIVKGLPRVTFDNLKTYIIIGGLGGFGLELADWLVTRGVRKLTLSSRQGVRNGYQLKRIRIWESYGVSVRISTADVTRRDGCFQLIKEAEDLGSVEGVFNLGVVLKDGAFENQSEKDFETSFGPKAFATKFLDEITRKTCNDLRYFVVFSSISCGRGNADQTNYGMANSVMERICEDRRKDGFPGLAIEWGAIGDVGLVAQLAKNNVELEIRGTLQQRISNCLEILDRLITQTESAIVSSMVVASKKKSYGSGSAVDAILSILGIKDVNTISRQATLAELGMDSITATEIIQVLETDFGIYLTAKDMRTMTLQQILDTENSGNGGCNENKITEFQNRFMTFMPESNISECAMSKMISNINNNRDKRKIVFVLPGFEGSVSSMEPITKNLECDCFVLKYNFTTDYLNIEDIAKCFIPAMEEKLTRGSSFNLICHSFGGHIGTEIANILENKGYIGKIFAIEAGVDYIFSGLEKTLNMNSEAEFESTFLCSIVQHLFPFDQLKFHKEKLTQFKTFKERIDYAYSIVPEEAKKKELVTDFERRAHFTSNRLRAVHNYNFSHEKIRSTVHLLKASIPVIPNIIEDYGWSQISRDLVNINVFEGNHSSVLNNQDMHFKIKEILEEVS